MRRLQKVLIANRAEIACRIARTCRRLGLAVATVHSTIDASARHVREIGESIELGGPLPRDSYLNIPAIVQAAKAAGADAVHPGYGFLSEDPDFARAVEAAGLVFIGPRPETLAALGDKANAKKMARKAGLALVPGPIEPSADAARLSLAVGALKLPVLLKAAGGGGGRGMALIEDLAQLEDRIQGAMREANGAFGRSELIVERFLPKARHIEVQIAGDGKGEAIHLYERECSLQRRYQKVIEEAPAPRLPMKLRHEICESACRLARAANYRGVGTVEYLLAGSEAYFLEVNARLQVEHPVTEAVTGVDLVELQLKIADEEALPYVQEDIKLAGHAIEARICAEDVEAGFLPQAGKVRLIDLPAPPVRVDAGIDSGDTVHPFYDSMIAKVIVGAKDRAAALAELRDALSRSRIIGVPTNLLFLEWLLDLEEVREGKAHTGLIQAKTFARRKGEALAPECVALAALYWLDRQRLDGADGGAWQASAFSGFRLNTGALTPQPVPTLVLTDNDTRWEVRISAKARDGERIVAVQDRNFRVKLLSPVEQRRFLAQVDARVFEAWCAEENDSVFVKTPLGDGILKIESPLAAAAAQASPESRLLAPMMGRIAKVHARDGERVAAGAVVVVLESMKMELRVQAPRDGVLRGLKAKIDDMVERGALLAEVVAD
jgi:3-methylcrotonyl-CoA carboxylase alpha subunit